MANTPKKEKRSKPVAGGAESNKAPAPEMVALKPQGGDKAKRAKQISKPFLAERVELNSHNAQMAFKRGFRVTAQACYSLGVVVRIITNDEAAAIIESAVDRQMDEVEFGLRGELKRLREILQQRGLPSTTKFDRPQVVEVEITSPRAARFMGIIRLLDEYVGVLGVLWLAKMIKESQFTNSSYEWQRSVVSAANRIHEIGSRATQKARELKKAVDMDAQDRINEVLKAAGIDPEEALSLGDKSVESEQVDLKPAAVA